MNNTAENAGRAADVLKPRDADDVREIVAAALCESRRLEVKGGGSKRAIGRPAQVDATLDLSDITGVTLYEPEELVLSARAGTPLAEIEALVAGKGQMLAFEPMDFAAVLGGTGGATLGGTIAANVSGPRRFKAGAARDHVLGFSAVSGRGETFKAGGRVVKNVTGYDLPKLMAGSWGTLAVLNDVTVKVLPRPETVATIRVNDLIDADAVRIMALAMRSSAEVSGAAHLPAPAALRATGREASATLLRLEGFAPSVAARTDLLLRLVAPFGATDVLDRDESLRLWRFVRDVEAFAEDRSRPLWRISAAPSVGPTVVATIGREIEDAETVFDWAGGLVWLSVPPSADAGAATVRQAVGAAGGGHATLIRAEPALRATVPVFEPEPPPLAALSARVKNSFDPAGLLNPGRMRPEA